MNPLNRSKNAETNPADAETFEKAQTEAHAPVRALQLTPQWGRWLIASGLGAGLLAGVGSWLIGEATVSAFNPPRTKVEMMGQTLYKASLEDQLSADAKNATLAFALLGGALGLALGIAGGFARHSAHAVLKVGVFGLVLGGLAGGGLSLVILPIYNRAVERSPEDMSHDILLPLLVHGGIWSACGLTGGLAFGIGLGAGRRRLFNAALGGLIGAALGAVLFEAVGALIFSESQTTRPISSTWNTRLLARLLVASLSGSLAAAVSNMPDRRRVEAKLSP
jgi:hypothetical protein